MCDTLCPVPTTLILANHWAKPTLRKDVGLTGKCHSISAGANEPYTALGLNPQLTLIHFHYIAALPNYFLF